MERLDLDLLMIRMQVCLAEQRFTQARRLLDEVLDEDPGHGVAHGCMAWLCWMLLDETDRAVQHYRFAIRFAPKHAEHHLNFARLLAQRGRLDELVEVHRNALDVPGIDRHTLHLVLGAAFEQAGRYQESLRAYRNAGEAATDPGGEAMARGAMQRVRRRIQARRWNWSWN